MNGPALNTDPRDPVAEELHLMKTAGIVEVACRNPNVMDAILHWEDRVQKAEAAVAAARAEGMREAEDLLKKAEKGLFWAQIHLRDKGLTSMNIDATLADISAAIAARKAGEASK